jgi:septal ring factor EnvC (AmiA/AmiB activator)
VEHIERQDERENELRQDADELEQKGDELEEESARLDKQIDETRDEFEQKKGSAEVPGAQPDEDDVVGTTPGDAAAGPGEDEDD